MKQAKAHVKTGQVDDIKEMRKQWVFRVCLSQEMSRIFASGEGAWLIHFDTKIKQVASNDFEKNFHKINIILS